MKTPLSSESNASFFNETEENTSSSELRQVVRPQVSQVNDYFLMHLIKCGQKEIG